MNAGVLVQVLPEPARVIAIDTMPRLREANPEAPLQARSRVIAPAPVNAHTHLDLSRMPYTPGGYLPFIASVVAHGRAGGRGVAAYEEGRARLRAANVSAVGDIVTDEGVLARLLADPELTGVAYWEVLGPDPDEADARFDATLAVYARHRAQQRPGGVRLGISPHTPHTVSPTLLQKLARWAHSERIPMQIHVAEDAAEVPLHATGSGPIREALGPFLTRFAPSGLRPVQLLASLGVLAARPTLVHAVHVDEQDVRLIQRAGCTVVHCPRSNEALSSGRFPWALYAKHGVTVALGTDSLGSSPSLSVVDEWEAAVAVHGREADPAQLLWSAVKGGYRALDLTPPRVTRGMRFDALWRWSGTPEARNAHAIPD